MEITAKMVKDLREKSGAGMMDCKVALQETNGNIEDAMGYLREKGIAKSLKKESRIAAEGLANVYVKGNKAVIIEVNSETDFVSKNEKFITLMNTIGETVLNSDVTEVEDALELSTDEGMLKDTIIANTATIGEKISFRRMEVINKEEGQSFGSYIHMGGRIAVLTVISSDNEEVAKDISMQSAAMKATYNFVEDVTEDVLEKEKVILKNKAIEEGKTPEIAEKMVNGGIKKFYKENCLLEQEFVKDSSITISKYLENNKSSLLKSIRFEVGEGIEKKEENFAEEVMKQIG